jgi:hypothetical protein
MEDDALTMRSVEHNGDEALTLLELVLRLEGEFRRSLAGCGKTRVE